MMLSTPSKSEFHGGKKVVQLSTKLSRISLKRDIASPCNTSNLSPVVLKSAKDERSRRLNALRTPHALHINAVNSWAKKPLGIYFIKECVTWHDNGSHVESADRLVVIGSTEIGSIYQNKDYIDGEWVCDRIEFAKDEDLERCHDAKYLEHLKTLCENLPEGPSSGILDMDTSVSRFSYDAARLACGAAIHATNDVWSGIYKRAFVCVRPPGHHAGPNGAVPSEFVHTKPDLLSTGFCLLNHVAVAAAHARANLRLEDGRSPRVAIIDFDVHHGNGTQKIVENLVHHLEELPLPQSWASIKYESHRVWKDIEDADNVFFSSIHLYKGSEFYPGSGPDHDSCERPVIINCALDGMGPAQYRAKMNLSAKARKKFEAASSSAFRGRLKKDIFPAMRKFKPDIIFISAGFDSHKDDAYYYLNEEDFVWATLELNAIADKFAEGRIVSCLEGGYHTQNYFKKSEKRKTRNQAAAKQSPSPPSSASITPPFVNNGMNNQLRTSSRNSLTSSTTISGVSSRITSAVSQRKVLTGEAVLSEYVLDRDHVSALARCATAHVAALVGKLPKFIGNTSSIETEQHHSSSRTDIFGIQSNIPSMAVAPSFDDELIDL